jgi:hypothetical protein
VVSNWTADEQRLAELVLSGHSVAVNVRKSGPHSHLVPWLVEHNLIVYIGHRGNRHSWPQSDFANPFVREAKLDREMMVRHYREWLHDQPELLRRLHSGELSGKALGCWCVPQRCHAEVLLEEIGS